MIFSYGTFFYLEMYSVYQLQFPLIHAKLSMVGLWIVLYLIHILAFDITLWREGRGYLANQLSFAHYVVPLNLFYISYTVFMIKGVSKWPLN